jgi:hypothetical protein
LSLARICFEQANVALEDVILAELAGDTMSICPMVGYLNQSLENIRDMKQYIDSLMLKMDHNHFTDLPTLQTIDLDVLGMRLVDNGMVEVVSWQKVVRSARQGGFRTVLCIILEEIRELGRYTQALISLVIALDSHSTKGGVHDVLEENQSGNIKIAFAQLYCRWSRFQQFFLASSLSSTEQWYVFMGYGSLVGRPVLINTPATNSRSVAALET